MGGRTCVVSLLSDELDFDGVRWSGTERAGRVEPLNFPQHRSQAHVMPKGFRSALTGFDSRRLHRASPRIPLESAAGVASGVASERASPQFLGPSDRGGGAGGWGSGGSSSKALVAATAARSATMLSGVRRWILSFATSPHSAS